MNDTTELEFQRRAHRLMVEALGCPAARRRAHVVRAAGRDTRLAHEVLAMLDAEGELGDFLDRPAVIDLQLLPDNGPDSTDTEPPAPVPERIGPFEILARIGSGGMGEVFHARQREPVRREVALKCIRANLPGSVRERFVLEQGVLARLGHTNVARFFDAGTTADGQPYFAMELVAGEPITRYCDAHELALAERLQLFVQICAGVEHAHRQQILHRDLKPSNVLVVEESGRPIPKVIDFGIAKALDRAETDAAPETGTLILGTPVYMSPEALNPEILDGSIDTRTDVYSLGVLLYELVCGCAPFERDDAGLLALIGRISGGHTQTPSQRIAKLPAGELEALAQLRGTGGHEWIKAVHGDLDWIVSKAMAVDREQRYGSVGDLAADVRRYLAHEPVLARPWSKRYRLHLFARRHRAAMLAAAVALAGLVLGLVGLGAGLVKAQREAAATRQALTTSREVSNFLIGLFDASRPGSRPASQITAADLLDRGARELGTQLKDQPAARERFLRAIGDVYVQIGRYPQAQTILAQARAALKANPHADPREQAALNRSLGVLAFHRGQWKKAERLLRAGTRGLNPTDDPKDWSLAVHNLGVTLYKQHRLDAAMSELQRALQVRQRLAPDDAARLNQSRNAIAAVYLDQGKTEQAAATFREVLAQRRKALGPDHVYVAMSLRNLALANRQLGHIGQAESQLRQAIAIDERALGPQSPDLAGNLGHLADLLRDFGDPAQAVAPMRRALAIHRANQGENNRLTARAMSRLGALLLKLGELDEAEKLLHESLAVRQKLEQSESSLEFPRMYLGLVALERGKLDAAQASLQHALTVWRKTLGPDAVSLSWPLLGLARIALRRGQVQQAQTLSSRALALRVKAYPAGHAAIARARAIHERATQAGP